MVQLEVELCGRNVDTVEKLSSGPTEFAGSWHLNRLRL